MHSELNSLRLKNLSIRARLIRACIFVFCAILIYSSISIFSLYKSNDALNKIVFNSNAKVNVLNHIKEEIYNIDLSYSTIISTKDQFLKEEMLEAVSQNKKALDSDLTFLSENFTTESSKEFIRELVEERAQLKSVKKTLTEVIKKNDDASANILFTRGLHPITRSMVEKINSVLLIEENFSKAEAENVTSFNRFTFFFIIILNILLLIMIVFLSYRFINSILTPLNTAIQVTENIAKGNLNQEIIIGRKDETGVLLELINEMQIFLRDIISKIRNSSEKSTKTAEEFLSVSSRFIRTAKEQESESEEVIHLSDTAVKNNESLFQSLKKANSDLQSINGNTQSINDSSLKINQLLADFSDKSQKTMNTAKTGESKIEVSISAMQEIKDSANKIQSVVTLITEISNKINLLALNASIEAARAGESGKGFAVVADEVSKLAVSTSSSIKEIRQLVSTSHENIAKGVTEVSQISSLFKEIIQSISNLSSSTDTILHDLKNQSSSSNLLHENIRELTKFLEQIDKTIAKQQSVSGEMSQRISKLRQSSEFISSGSMEIETSASNLSSQSESIKTSIEKFEI